MPEWNSVRVAFTSNVALTGTPIGDSVQTVALDEVGVFGNTNGAENGIYTIPSGGGAWTRRTDANAAAHFTAGKTVYVREGIEHGGSNWQFKNGQAPTLGVSMLNFRRTSRPDVDEAGAGLERSGASIGLTPRGGVQGRRTNPTLELDQYGLPTVVSAGTVPSTFIEGLTSVRVSNTAVTLRAGSAWVPGLEAVLEAPADIAKTGLVLAANTIYYAYLWSNAGVADLELSTTAPAAPYRGIAKTKTGDTTRRYVGELTTDATGAITIIGPRSWDQATESERGGASIATDAQVATGTNDRPQMTPLKLKNEFDRRKVGLDVGWTNVPTASHSAGWDPHPTWPARWRKEVDGTVQLGGRSLGPVGGAAAGSIAFTLPVGARPATQRQMPATRYSGATESYSNIPAEVGTGGGVKILVSFAGGDEIVLDAIRFSVY